MIEKSKVSSGIVSLINQSAVLMCMGNMEQAKVKLDAALELVEGKVVEGEIKNILPSYMVNILIYFFLKTSKHFYLSNFRESKNG